MNEIDSLLTRFLSPPLSSEGLSHEELLTLLQMLVDNGRIYDMPLLQEYAEVYCEVGWIYGYDSRKTKT